MHEIFLVPEPRVGKQKKCIRNTKPYNVSASMSTEQHTNYIILDLSITVSK